MNIIFGDVTIAKYVDVTVAADIVAQVTVRRSNEDPVPIRQ